MNKPFIVYKSSLRIESCLLAWQDYFDNHKIPYDTDLHNNTHRNLSLSLPIIWGSIKNKNLCHHIAKKKAIKNAHQFVQIETSLIGRRKTTEHYNEDHFRIGINGFLANTAKFINHQMPPDRWEVICNQRGISLKPWNLKGNYILVVLQLPGDASLQGANISRWVYQTCRDIRDLTDLPILVRKPQLERKFNESILSSCTDLRDVQIVKGTHENLNAMIDDSIFCCTYSSGMGIDCLLRGKPVVAYSRASFVYPNSTSLLDAINSNFNLRSRDLLFSNLAYCQWSIDEIRNGQCWNHLSTLLPPSSHINP